ncbi:hypothetical protein [Sphaerothrix gracilis]|uniref:hypothetical protein n=1 Tax=Sphaerothrix gracilis TaxID=3151835 RepID=UPI0031FDE33F
MIETVVTLNSESMNMSANRSFEKVIRQVEKDARTRPSERLLIIEKKKKEVKVHQKGSFLTSVFGGTLSYYIVANDSDSSNLAEGDLKCTVRDFKGDRRIDIVIDYEVSCPPGREETALYALCAGNLQPEVELKAIATKYVDEYSRSDGDHFINNYISEVSRLEELVTYGVQQETGLSFRLRISLDRENDLKPFVIQPTSFSVRVMDYDDAFDVNLHAEFIVDEEHKVRAVLEAGREIKITNLVKEGIRKYLRANVSTRQFYSDLNTSIRNQLVDYINDLVVEYGRKVNFLSLNSDAIASAPQEFEEIKTIINCEIHDPVLIPFSISNVLQMELNDIAKYRMSHISSLENWVNSKLEPIIKTALFEKTYIEVLSDFSEISGSIKRQMEQAADDIGYSVKQIVSIPELEPLKLTKDFDVEVEDESFTLKDAKVEVRLNIISTLHIPDLKAIAKELSPNVDTKDLIRKHLIDVVRRFLNQIEPERFYMRFSAPATDRGEKRSIEEELSETIKAALEEKFKAKLSGTVIKTLDTEIKVCYERLFERVGTFELQFNSFKDGKPAYLNGDFQINGVEQFSWYTFQARKPSLESIQNCIKKSILAKLSNLPSEILSYNNIETQTLLEQLVAEVATESVVKQFGLLIEVNNVSRRLTELEELKSGAEQQLEKFRINKIASVAEAGQLELNSQLRIVEASSQASVDELETLLARRQQIIAAGDPEELEELNEEIEKLQANPPSGSVEDAEKLLKSMRMQESDANHLLGFSRQIKSLKAGSGQADETDKITDTSVPVSDDENELSGGIS